MTRIAILGATGHIGTALSHHYAGCDVTLDLYSRSPERTAARVAAWKPRARINHLSLSSLDFSAADIVINALGAGEPRRLQALGTEILTLTLRWEEIIARALDGNPSALYVFLSSGAIYGRLVEGPAKLDSKTSFYVNNIPPEDAYKLAKFVAEVGHRARPFRRTIDIRLFGFVSRFLDLNGGYFLSELFSALVQGRIFNTAAEDMMRDYVGTEELAALIACCALHSTINLALDIYSSHPVHKFELLKQLERLGLRWKVDASIAPHPERVSYASNYDFAKTFGYSPKRSAADIVEQVALQLINGLPETASVSTAHN